MRHRRSNVKAIDCGHCVCTRRHRAAQRQTTANNFPHLSLETKTSFGRLSRHRQVYGGIAKLVGNRENIERPSCAESTVFAGTKLPLTDLEPFSFSGRHYEHHEHHHWRHRPRLLEQHRSRILFIQRGSRESQFDVFAIRHNRQLRSGNEG